GRIGAPQATPAWDGPAAHIGQGRRSPCACPLPAGAAGNCKAPGPAGHPRARLSSAGAVAKMGPGPWERRSMWNRAIVLLCALLFAALAGLAGCGRGPDDAVATQAEPPTPGETVRLLTAHLADADLGAFARDAVTPELHAQLRQAWAEGRTRWPLDQLPFAPHLPRAMAALSAPDAERRLQQAFDRQLANTSLAAAAEFLTVFTVQYIAQQGEFSVSEREHYPQLVQALGTWAAQAPLGDRAHAQATIAAMAA